MPSLSLYHVPSLMVPEMCESTSKQGSLYRLLVSARSVSLFADLIKVKLLVCSLIDLSLRGISKLWLLNSARVTLFLFLPVGWGIGEGTCKNEILCDLAPMMLGNGNREQSKGNGNK